MNQNKTEEMNQANEPNDPSAVEDQNETSAQEPTATGTDDVGSDAPTTEAPELQESQETSEEISDESEETSEIEQLLAELAEAKRQAEDAEQRWLRAQADFDNYRRRTRQEKEQFTKYAAQQVVEQLLPVIDNFERAIASSAESQDFDSLAKGIDMVFRQMMNVLENEGLQPIEAIGAPFDPEVHQAVMRVESEEHEEGIVVEELQKGYKLKEKVLRPSMVKVSS